MKLNRISKKSGFYFTLTLLMGLCHIPLFSPLALGGEAPRRALELELEEVPDGKGYEIEVTRILEDHTRRKPVLFKLGTTKWSATLVPGNYEMRVRSLDSRGVPGEWGEPRPLLVRLPQTELLTPETGQTIKSEDKSFADVSFSWKAIQGAAKYHLKIVNSKSETVRDSFEIADKIKIELPVAEGYSWEVTPVTADAVAGDSVPEPHVFEIHGPRLDKPKILAVEDINTKKIAWKKDDFSTRYHFSLEIKTKSGFWKKIESRDVETQERLLSKDLPTGTYRVKVKAFADKRENSEIAEKEFKTLFVGERSPAAIEQVRAESTYETKTSLFALASYYVTVINYLGTSLEANSTTSFNAIGGTGKVGLGTWFTDSSRWGILGVSETSGFTVSSGGALQTFTYEAASLQAVYRMRAGALGQFRFYAGPEYRELPITVASASSSGDSQYTGSKMATVGPLVGVALNHGFAHRFGLQINLQAMDSLAAPINPGGANNPVLSYQAGLLGSISITERLLGFLGYAYRVEQASYVAPGADTSTGQILYQGQRFDSVGISGHYFNLMVEYGF